MAKRTLSGQLHMFDFYRSMEGEVGEVEMVSLMPNFDAEPEVVDEPEAVEVPEVVDEPKTVEAPEVVDEPETADEPATTQVTQEQVAMSRTYEIGGETLEIAYINYNKVRITRGGNPPEIKLFASSKEAVDYYVEKMQELEDR